MKDGSPIAEPAAIMHETKRDLVANWLRRRILSGEFRPGEALTQQSVAAATGVSHTPVREAFRLLEAEGILTALSHHGAMLPILTEEDVRDLYLIRKNLETLATTMAVERGGPDLAERLAEVQQRLEIELERDLSAVPALNRTFHFTIYAEARSPRLTTMIERLWAQCPAYWLKSVPNRVKDQIMMHGAVIEAVQAGDAEAAAAAIGHHIDEAASSLIAMLPELTRTMTG